MCLSDSTTRAFKKRIMYWIFFFIPLVLDFVCVGYLINIAQRDCAGARAASDVSEWNMVCRLNAISVVITPTAELGRKPTYY